MGIDQITETVFICASRDLDKVSQIRSLKIDSVLSLDAQNERFKEGIQQFIKPNGWKLAEVKDIVDSDLSRLEIYVSQVRNPVQELEQLQDAGGRTLVCCVGGTGRSPLVVASYLFLVKKFSPEQAASTVKEHRKGAWLGTIDEPKEKLFYEIVKQENV